MTAAASGRANPSVALRPVRPFDYAQDRQAHHREGQGTLFVAR